MEEPEPLGRGGGLRLARREPPGAGRRATPLNGDELIDVDFGGPGRGARQAGDAATITVAPLRSAFGVVDLDGDGVAGFEEAPRLPVLGQLRGLRPRRGGCSPACPSAATTSARRSPSSPAEGRLRAFRHEGLWLTVNTPKDLRTAEEYVAANPGVARRRVTGSGCATSSPSRHVDKPWGYELHFALTDRYCGKVLFVRAGESLSLQYHEREGRDVYLQSGLARAHARRARRASSPSRRHRASGALVPPAPGNRAPPLAIEDTTYPRGVDTAARRRRAARGPLRPERSEAEPASLDSAHGDRRGALRRQGPRPRPGGSPPDRVGRPARCRSCGRSGERFERERPLAGQRVSACLHVTTETANLARDAAGRRRRRRALRLEPALDPGRRRRGARRRVRHRRLRHQGRGQRTPTTRTSRRRATTVPT